MKYWRSSTKKFLSLLLVAILLYYNIVIAIPYVVAETLGEQEQVETEMNKAIMNPDITQSNEPTDSSKNENLDLTENESKAPQENTSPENPPSSELQPNIETHGIVIGKLTNGTIEVDDLLVEKGKNTKIHVTPSSGYYLEELTIEGKQIVAPIYQTTAQIKQQEQRNQTTTYDIINVQQNVQVEAIFKKLIPTITFVDSLHYTKQFETNQICEDLTCLSPVTVEFKAAENRYFKEDGKLVDTIKKTYAPNSNLVVEEQTVEGYKVGLAVKAESKLKIEDPNLVNEMRVEKGSTFTVKLSVDDLQKQLAGVEITANQATSNQKNENPSTNAEIEEQACLVPVKTNNQTTSYEFGNCERTEPTDFHIKVKLVTPSEYEVTFSNIQGPIDAVFFSKDVTEVKTDKFNFTKTVGKEEYLATSNKALQVKAVNAHKVTGQEIYLSKNGYVEFSFTDEYATSWNYAVGGKLAKLKSINLEDIPVDKPLTIKQINTYSNNAINKVVLQEDGLVIYKDTSAPTINNITFDGSEKNGFVKGVRNLTFKVDNNTAQYNSPIDSVVAVVNEEIIEATYSERNKSYSIKIPSKLHDVTATYQIIVTDIAGNEATSNLTLKTDTVAPVLDGKIDILTKQTKDGIVSEFFGSIGNFFKYGTFVPNTFEMYIPTADLDGSGVNFDKTQILDKNGRNIKAEYKDGYYIVKTKFDLEEDETTLRIVLVDHLGNKSEEILVDHINSNLLAEGENFKIDNSAPKFEVEYDLKPIELDDVSYFTTVPNFTLSATDKGSGLDTIHYELTAINSGKSTKLVDELIELNEGNTEEIEEALTSVEQNFTIPENSLNSELLLKLTVTDAVGNSTEKLQKLVVDTEQPNLKANVHVSGAATNNEKGFYTNKEIKFSVKPDDKFIGVESVKLTDAFGNDIPLVSDKRGEFIFELKVESFNSNVTLTMIDKLGNEYVEILTNKNSNLESTTGLIVVDQVKPSIQFTPPEAQYIINNKLFYSDDTELQIAVTDEGGLNYWTNKLNDLSAVEYNGTQASISTVLASQTTDNIYTYKVYAKDLAGNETTDEFTIYVDKTIPSITHFEYIVNEEAQGVKTEAIEVVEDKKLNKYLYFFKEKVQVKVHATDDKENKQTESGVKAIIATAIDYSDPTNPKEYLVLQNGDLQLLEANSTIYPITTENNEIIVNIPDNFKGSIYATPIDQVGHQGKTFSQDGTIHETIANHELAEHITVDLPPSSYTTEEGHLLYATAVDLNITAEDVHSGIQKVEWSIKGESERGKNQSGKIEVDTEGKLTGNTAGWSILSKDQNLITKMTAPFTVNQDSNNITLTVKLTDRTGHVSEKAIVFAIDQTKPSDVKVSVESKYKKDHLYKDVQKIIIDAKDDTSNKFNSGIKAVNIKYVNDQEEEVITSVPYDVKNKKYIYTVPVELANQTMTYTIEAIDRANNKTVTTEMVTVDTTAPVINLEDGLKVTIKPLESNLPKVVQSFINFITFGSYTPNRFEISIPAVDLDNGSGVDMSKTKLVLSNGKELSVDYKGNNTFVVEAKANQVIETTFSVVLTDYFDNVSPEYLINNDNSDIAQANGVITIDTVAPTIEVVNDRTPEYSNQSIEYFKGSHTFNYSIFDEHARILQYSYSLNSLKENVSFELDSDTKSDTGSVTIPTELHNQEVSVEIQATDRVGNTSSFNKSIFVDNLAPNVSNIQVSGAVTNNEQGLFTNKKVKIDVTTTDSGSGIQSVEILDSTNQAIPVSKQDDENFVFEINEDAFDSALTLVVTDNVGNINKQLITNKNSNLQSPTGRIVIDKIAPELVVSPNEAPIFTKGDRHFYNKDLDITIDVLDNHAIDVTTLVFRDEEPVTYNSNGALTETQVINTSKYVVKDNVYHYKVDTTDYAGNRTKQELIIYIDKTDPVVTQFEFAVKQGSSYQHKTTKMDPSVMEVLESYMYYFKEDVQVTVSATDDLKDVEEESGLKAIAAMLVDYSNPAKLVRYEVLADGNLKELKQGEEPKLIPTSKTIKINIPKNFKGAIYATPYDNAFNIGDMVSPGGVINESKSHHEQEMHIDIKKPTAPFKTGFGQDLYAKDVPLNITIKDTYSGIEKIEWSIISEYDTAQNSNGTLTIDNDGKMSGDTANWSITKKDRNLITEMKRNLTVSNNSNDIRVMFKMTDRTGHTSSKQVIFSIDKTKPSVNVVYDLNKGDAVYNDYYKTTRTATVTVTERNFSKKDVIATITNTEGSIPTISNWSTVVDRTNPDNNKHVATITYAADGDYTFDIDVLDYAKNSSANYAGDRFTIDKTEPKIQVSYNSQSQAQNGKYFNSVRTATIAITEHNFDPGRVTVKGISEHEGSAFSYPSHGNWSKNGDVYSTTITYAKDGNYTFDIEFTDMAGNVAADYAPDEFVIDLTAPEVKITGVENETAYNDVIEPQIQYYDTNLNTDGVDLSLVGFNRGEVTSTVQRSNIPNGENIVVKNLEKVEENDDIYTLNIKIRDLAGNETTNTVRYSVNRFGSTYMVVGEAEKLVNNYSNQEVDVVIHEINVDSLVNEAIQATVVKNGTPSTLQQSTDYTVKHNSSSANWSVYEYVMSKSLFENDGKYALNLYSKDNAGNVNDSTDPSKEFSLEFVIDKTAPLLTSLNLENKKTYALDNYIGKFSVTDNFVVDDVTVEINGEEVAFEQVNDEIHVSINRSNKARDIAIQVTDKANNFSALVLKDITVTTNLAVRFVNNKPLLYSTTGGVTVVSLAVAGYFIFRRPKVVE